MIGRELWGVAFLLVAGGLTFGLEWLAQPVITPRWILLLFLLLPVGDIQAIMAQSTRVITSRLEGLEGRKRGGGDRQESDADRGLVDVDDARARARAEGYADGRAARDGREPVGELEHETNQDTKHEP